MSLNLVTLLYLFASVCFIQALKGLSHPTTSIRGNLFGMIGMGVAMVTTAIPMPIMPNRLPRIEVVGCDRPFSAWMKQIDAIRYRMVTRFMLISHHLRAWQAPFYLSS